MDFTASYGRPIQGVSQQPPQIRQEGQCTEQINCIPSPVDGLKTRVGSEFIGAYATKMDKSSKVHFYRRDEEHAYIVIINDNGDVEVYDTEGNAQQTTFSANDYIKTKKGNSTVKDRISMVTVGDYTFIANADVDVKVKDDKYPDPLRQAVITVSYASYGRTYKVTINDTKEFSYKAPSGDTPTDIDKVDTTYVATKLFDAISKDTDITVQREGRYLYINMLDQSDFTIKVEDGAGGEDLLLAKGVINKLSKLPARAPDNTYVAIREEGATEIAEYYLKVDGFRSDGKANWVETAKAGVIKGFDESTMPHVLVRDSVDPNTGIGTFSLKAAEWADRGVGNDKSNPLPSFYNKDNPRGISSIGVFQNRLYVTSGENLITSRTDDYYDFFRLSAQKAVDSDPIDILSDTKSLNIIQSSATIGGDLVLFAERSQFLLKGDIPQTKKTATLSVISEYECVSEISPVSSGDNLYFPFTYGRYGGVREMFVDNNTGTKRARPITDHVDKYIDGHITNMAGSTNINTLFINTDSEENTLYVYDWIWVGDQKAQSAWHKWVVGEDSNVIGFEYLDNKLMLVSIKDDKAELIIESFDMSDPPTYDLDFRVRMDRRVKQKFTYDSTLEVWTGTVPEGVLPKDITKLEIVTIDSDSPIDNGNIVPVDIDPNTRKISTTYPLSSDKSREVALSIGTIFDVEYEPTPPSIKDYKGQVSTINKTILGSLYFNFDHVGHFTIEVEDKYGYKWSGDFNNRRVGAINNIVGFAPLIDLVEEVPVRRLAKDTKFRIKTRTHISMQLRDIEWSGVSNPSKGRR